MQQLDIFGSEPLQAARERGELGMARAADHAERLSAGWSARALAALGAFARAQEAAFTIEAARASIDIDEPPDGRAWGAVTQAAIRRGVIAKTGNYAPAASSNGSPKALYRSGGSGRARE